MFEGNESIIPWQHIHPILVNFTAALVPVSVGSDVLAKLLRLESLKSTAWWTLLFAALITPLTVFAGWFWRFSLPAAALSEDLIFIHQWLGTLCVLLFIILAIWRGWLFLKNRETSYLYLLLAFIVVAALMYQGSLGGKMVFG
jgi:uncharacterized membrane protein